ncbi:MAG TPA: hypothetical protein VGE68_10765 [Sphingomicrobium sp.]
MTKLLSKPLVFAIGTSLVASPVLAGEITGPPPTGNGQNTPGTISNGNSRCSFSGLNDTPDGIPGIDPGGQVQSYGYFMSHFGLFDPSDPDQRASFAFPGEGCNPTRTGGTH